MSDAVIIVIITGLFGLITLFINRLFKKMDDKLNKYHAEINGNMTKLLEVTGAAEKAKGNLEGKAEQKADSISTAQQVTEAIKADPGIEVKLTDPLTFSKPAAPNDTSL